MARKPKGEITRSETLAIRLDPRTRYMLELAGRIQHRTLSSVVEWMINNSLKDILISDNLSLANVQADLWDIDEPDRLVKLALQYPYLLNFEEQKIWKVIIENAYFWKGRSEDGEWMGVFKMKDLHFDRIRKYWTTIQDMAKGEELSGILPKN